MPINYDAAKDLFAEAFEQAENTVLAGDRVELAPRGLSSSIDKIFTSSTQAYREALMGCLLARILDKSVDVRSPYVSQGDNAYNGRTLDERVVNPTLQNHRIPSSRGPFLSVFRRSVQFT